MFYHIITIGCQMNKADSERLAAYLETHGFKPVDKPAEADLVALVTCGVRQMAEDRIYGLVKQIKQDKPTAKVILTGCLSDRPDVQKRLGSKIDLYFNITELPRLAAKLGLEADNGSNAGYLSLQAKYQSAFSAYVPIGNGCNNFCAYCVVPYARGREVYRGHEEILDEVRRLVAHGYKEIILIAQNVNSYKSGDVDFPALLKMVDAIDGDFWLRFATSHPKDLSDKLIDTVAASKKICRHWHIAAQSGDDDILKLMNRKYTAEQFLNLVKKIRANPPAGGPPASVSTDIIVGFPGESEAQFNNSKKLMEQAGFSMAYLAQYSPRPNTTAAKLTDDVSAAEKKQREEELNEILKQTALEFNQKFVGQTVKVLVDEERNGWCLGKNEQFITVKFKAAGLLGKFAQVKIKEAKPFGLNGEYVR